MSHWIRDDTTAAAITDDESAIGWQNEDTGEVVVRTESPNDIAPYVVYHYTDTWGDGKHGVNRSVLFRPTDGNVVETIEPHLPEDGYLDVTDVRASELTEPQTLGEWAHINGAKYHMTEKIGNCKRSSGDVALFDGSSRRGNGAYVALAKENGPRGREYASVGYKTNGYYRVSTEGLRSGRNSAYELEWPNVTFTQDKVVIKNDRGDKITVTVL